MSSLITSTSLLHYIVVHTTEVKKAVHNVKSITSIKYRFRYIAILAVL